MVASGRRAAIAVGEASVEEIDRINILQATFLAMRRALQALAEQPDLVLIDGNQVPPELGCRAETIVGGDARSYSIAAASIFAKVTRDRYMRAAGRVASPATAGRPIVGYSYAKHLRRPQAARAHAAPPQELRAGSCACSNLVCRWSGSSECAQRDRCAGLRLVVRL